MSVSHFGSERRTQNHYALSPVNEVLHCSIKILRLRYTTLSKIPIKSKNYPQEKKHRHTIIPHKPTPTPKREQTSKIPRKKPQRKKERKEKKRKNARLNTPSYKTQGSCCISLLFPPPPPGFLFSQVRLCSLW